MWSLVQCDCLQQPPPPPPHSSCVDPPLAPADEARDRSGAAAWSIRTSMEFDSRCWRWETHGPCDGGSRQRHGTEVNTLVHRSRLLDVCSPERAPRNTSHSAPISMGSPSDVPVPCISSEPTSAALLSTTRRVFDHQQQDDASTTGAIGKAQS